MGFQQGLSGLFGAAQNLDVIGNNIANTSTVGFKSSTTQFADVYATSLTGTGSLQVGIGTQVAAIAQKFTQGNTSVTNNPLDLAINGEGFFRMDNAGLITYTRNGQFQLDKDGYVVNNSDMRLTGYSVDPLSGQPTTAAAAPIQVSFEDIAPNATGLASMVLNLDASKTPPATTPFDPADVASYNNATAITLYDSLGNARAMTLYFAKLDQGPALATSQVDLTVTLPSPSTEVVAIPDDVAFDPALASSYTASSTATLYDSSGIPQDMTLYFVKTPVDNEWRMHGRFADGTPVDFDPDPDATSDSVTLTFDPTSGALATPDGGILSGLTAPVGAGLTFDLDLSGSVETDYVFSVISFSQDGAAQVSEPNQWSMYGQLQVDGTSVGVDFGAGAGGPQRLSFDSSGVLTTTMPFPDASAYLAGSGATTPMAFDLSLTGSTQYGSNFGINSVSQDGYSSGRIASLSISQDGLILGNYTNGQSNVLGQVAIANFVNPRGLQSLGNNQWAETSESGQPTVGAPGSGTLGIVQSGAVEESNVDLTAELVNLIVAQRMYQANAQTIQAQDQILQTLINIR